MKIGQNLAGNSRKEHGSSSRVRYGLERMKKRRRTVMWGWEELKLCYSHDKTTKFMTFGFHYVWDTTLEIDDTALLCIGSQECCCLTRFVDCFHTSTSPEVQREWMISFRIFLLSICVFSSFNVYIQVWLYSCVCLFAFSFQDLLFSQLWKMADIWGPYLFLFFL